MIIETCPKCGHDLEETVLTTNPPILVKRCLHCGWRWEWGQKNITRIPFQDRIVKDMNVLIKTNADRIRSMTDEELTKFFIDLMQGNCPRPTSECFGECEACWLEWLKQEASNA